MANPTTPPDAEALKAKAEAEEAAAKAQAEAEAKAKAEEERAAKAKARKAAENRPLDQTVPGGWYILGGVAVDANGKPIEDA